MDKTDPVLIEANKWFKKLNDPSSGTFKIAHARRSEEAKSIFVPAEILEQFRKTADERIKRLATAVASLGQ